jgi:hypothetical protein
MKWGHASTRDSPKYVELALSLRDHCPVIALLLPCYCPVIARSSRPQLSDLRRNYNVDFLSDFLTRFISQLQSPTLGFLIGGGIIAALNSQLQIPDSIYKFIVFMLLIKVGLKGGIGEHLINAMSTNAD